VRTTGVRPTRFATIGAVGRSENILRVSTMRQTIVGIVAVLAVVVLGDLLEFGVTEARAQYIGVPVAAPGRYTMRVRPNGMVRVRGQGYMYGAPVVDPMVTVAAFPATYVTSAPMVMTTRVVTTAPAPMFAAPAFAPVPVYARRYMAAPTYTVVQPRVYMAPAVIGYPY
jgi:hypothetical protein